MKNRHNIFSVSPDWAHFREINIVYWNPDNVRHGKREEGEKLGKRKKTKADRRFGIHLNSLELL